MSLTDTAAVKDGDAVGYTGTVEAGGAVTGTHVAHVVACGSVGDPRAVQTRLSITFTHVADVEACRTVGNTSTIDKLLALAERRLLLTVRSHRAR